MIIDYMTDNWRGTFASAIERISTLHKYAVRGLEHYRIIRMIKIEVTNIHTTMMIKKGGGMLHGHDSKALSEDSLSAMLATALVPRAGDEENHFPARGARRTNRQGSRPPVLPECQQQ